VNIRLVLRRGETDYNGVFCEYTYKTIDIEVGNGLKELLDTNFVIIGADKYPYIETDIHKILKENE
jgi:hypothetical protein